MESTEGVITNKQSRETGNIGYTRRRKNNTKTEHNIGWTPPYTNNAYRYILDIQISLKQVFNTLKITEDYKGP